MELIDLNMNLERPAEIKYHCPLCEQSSFGYYESFTPASTSITAWASSSDQYDLACAVIAESTNPTVRHWNLKLTGVI